MACLVLECWIGGLGEEDTALCFWIALWVLTVTGSIPMASSAASATTSVVPCPSPVSRQSGFQRFEVEVLGGDSQQQGFAQGFGGGWSLGGHGVVSGVSCVIFV